jgi:hypothetical protein
MEESKVDDYSETKHKTVIGERRNRGNIEQRKGGR